MPATLYLRPSPRAYFLLTETHALVFRQPDASESKASRSVVVAEFIPIDEVDMRGLVRASKGRTVEGVLGVTSVPSDRSPIPEIFLLLVSHSTTLPPLLPHSTLRPSKVLAVEFHSLTSSFWDPPDLVNTSIASTYGEYDSLDYDDPTIAGPGPSSTSTATSSLSQAAQQGVENPCNGMRKYLESGGFFFAEGCNWDISSRMGETNWVQAELNGSNDGIQHPLETFDERFVWNKSLLAPFLTFRSALSDDMRAQLDSQSLLIPVIQGYCGSSPLSTGNWRTDGKPEVAAIGMISRLSWKRAGARFRTRGIDDDGQVANFVETELILATENVVMSYVQVRGSVPLFWQQPSAGIQTLQQKVEITRPPQATQPAFDKHFLELLEQYHSVHAVNLLGQKDAESMLSAAYSDHLATLKYTLEPPQEKEEIPGAPRGMLQLTPYDFHSAVKANGQETVKFDFSTRLGEVMESMENFGWTAIDATTGQVIEQQQGVFRTNCLDCLDRTNYVQNVMAQLTLQRFLVSIDSPLQSSATIWAAHRELWADNGDRLSKIYAGTGAINTSATRSGKKTFAGLLSDATKSVGRAYINNFQDKGKQTAIDMLLGMMAGQRPVILFDPISDSVHSALKARVNEYSSTRVITIFSGTWNLNGKAPDEALDSWLFPANAPEYVQLLRLGRDPVAKLSRFSRPDIYQIAFQEIVELTPGQILQTDPAKKRMWEKYIMDTFAMRKGKKSEYLLFRGEQLVGTALIVLVKSDLAKCMRGVESTTKKTGLQGLSGNKGGVGIRFDLFDSSICFVSCHLAAGHSNVSERNADWRTVVGGMKFLRGKMIDDHEVIVWAADFNYRIGSTNAEVRDSIEAGDFDALLAADQLLNAMDTGEVFMGYDEGPIRFSDNGTDDYDTSDKQRIPAWTDRVLFKGPALRLKEYNRAELMTSDHRPVYAVFDATIREIDHARKDAISKELLHSILRSGGAGEERLDDKVEKSLGYGGGVKDVVRGLANVSVTPALRGDRSPRLPLRPSSAASMQEKGTPTIASGRTRSISSLQAPPSSVSASSTLRAFATNASGSSTLHGGGARRAPPPIPSRASIPVPSSPDRRVPPAVPRPAVRVVSNGTGSSTTSVLQQSTLGTSSPSINPSSTGDFVVIPSGPSSASAVSTRKIPPLPPRPGSLTPKTSFDTTNRIVSPPSRPPQSLPRKHVPKQSFGPKEASPIGLVSPVSPDMVMAKLRQGLEDSSPAPSGKADPPATSVLAAPGLSTSPQKGKPVVPRKPVALRGTST
ncbi:hypothetical protein IAR55_002432 [Kwoniella newhampshirensis]|uniref:phosphoinositide 5-phosphatase n=1 Tax=Kwoniella newhampshirensis TaxID=1651941 RepID=A0AAW0YSM9_9TREE